MLKSLKKCVQNTTQSDAERTLLECLPDVSLPPKSSEPLVEEKITTACAISRDDGQETFQGGISQIMSWVESDSKRWERIHSALLRIYTPRWECVDARDTLVAWAGAWLALTRATNQLKRLQSLKRPLTWNDRNDKGGKDADISFYGRLTKRLDEQIPAALSNDVEAARLLTKLCSEKVKNEQ